MKTVITIARTDGELQELYRIILDRDDGGALAFLDEHLKKKVHQALEGR